MTVCRQCQREVTPGAPFCASCGAPVWSDGEVADPFVGRTFKATYFVQEKIGGGGMGQVYKAVHVTLDVPVALKILKKNSLTDPIAVQRFHREARAASRLRHPNVISVTDFGETEDGTLFMVMEYVAGKDLAHVIAEESPLSDQRVVRIGAQILAGLEEAHASQILHRDLKPENVMVESRRDEPDLVKVFDFGIAKAQVVGDERGTITQAGLFCGTPNYMSPEQWNGEPLDARSDLYAVGVILYEMLTGGPPYRAHTPMEIVRKHLTETPVRPSERRPDDPVSPDLEALVMRALSANRDDRPATAEQMRKELLACELLPEPSGGRRASSVKNALPPPFSVEPASKLLRTPTPPIQIIVGGASVDPRAPTQPFERNPVNTDPVQLVIKRKKVRRRQTSLWVTAATVVVAFSLGGVFWLQRGSAGKTAMGVSKPSVPPTSPTSLPTPTGVIPSTGAPSVTGPAVASEPVAAPMTSGMGSVPSSRPPVAINPIRDPPPREGRSPVRKRVEVSNHLNFFKLPPARSGQGILSISADPYGYVFLDNQPYGEVPREFRLTAGSYRARVTHPLLGTRETRIKVQAGKRIQWAAEFVKN